MVNDGRLLQYKKQNASVERLRFITGPLLGAVTAFSPAVKLTMRISNQVRIPRESVYIPLRLRRTRQLTGNRKYVPREQ